MYAHTHYIYIYMHCIRLSGSRQGIWYTVTHIYMNIYRLGQVRDMVYIIYIYRLNIYYVYTVSA